MTDIAAMPTPPQVTAIRAWMGQHRRDLPQDWDARLLAFFCALAGTGVIIDTTPPLAAAAVVEAISYGELQQIDTPDGQRITPSDELIAVYEAGNV